MSAIFPEGSTANLHRGNRQEAETESASSTKETIGTVATELTSPRLQASSSIYVPQRLA